MQKQPHPSIPANQGEKAYKRAGKLKELKENGKKRIKKRQAMEKLTLWLFVAGEGGGPWCGGEGRGGGRVVPPPWYPI